MSVVTVDFLICNSAKGQVAKYISVWYVWERKLLQESVKLCRELLNSGNSNLKSYQITFVLFAIEQLWKLTRGNISSIKNCLQLKHLNDNWLPDWLTSIIKDCLTDWLTKQPIEWLTDQLIDWLIKQLSDLLTDCLALDWLIDWLTKWLIDWWTVMKAGRQSFRYTKSPCGSQWLLWCVMQSHITKDNRKYSRQAFAMQIGMVAQHEIKVSFVHTSISQPL